MRPISKGMAPADFEAWKAGESADWAPDWKSFEGAPRPLRDGVRRALLQEQGYVCCYCEQRIAEGRMHIEHLEPRSRKPERSLDYGNLLACCQQAERRAPRHCGSRKGERFLGVHPLLPNCREYFVFTGSGEVHPSSVPALHGQAKEALEILGLHELNASRKKAIDGALELLGEVRTREQAAKLVALFDGRDSEGHNAPFASAIVSVLLRT